MKKLLLALALLVGASPAFAQSPGIYLQPGPIPTCVAGNTLVFNGTNFVCSSAGTGTITGSGTSGTIAKFTAAGAIGNSIITESGATASVAGTWSATQLILRGSTSGTLNVKCPATCGATTLTLPAGTTDFSATGGAGQVLRQSSTGAAFTVATIAFSDLTGSLASTSLSDTANLARITTTNTFSLVQTFTLQPIMSSLTASSAVATDSSKGLVSVANTGTGNNVLSASPTLTGTVGMANGTFSGTLGVTGVATFTAQDIHSSLTASQAVFTDGSKGLVSNAITGTGNVVMSASPTLTGTIGGANMTLSGTLGVTGAITSATSVALTGTTNSVGTITSGVWNAGALTSSGSLVANATSTINSSGPSAILTLHTTTTSAALLSFENTTSGVLAQINATNALGIQLLVNQGNSFGLEITAAQQIRIRGYGAGTLTTDASGNVTATSDARMKQDFTPVRAGLTAVMRLHPVSYRWRDTSGLDTTNRYVGFTAQDVQQALGSESGVFTSDKGVMTMSDRAIIAALVNAVQEQQKELKRLQQSIR